jgi:hypothetical protein
LYKFEIRREKLLGGHLLRQGNWVARRHRKDFNSQVTKEDHEQQCRAEEEWEGRIEKIEKIMV